MGQWLKANGGALAVLILGLFLAGFQTDLGWILVVLGGVWFVGLPIVRRLPVEVRRRRRVRLPSDEAEDLAERTDRAVARIGTLFADHTRYTPEMRSDEVGGAKDAWMR